MAFEVAYSSTRREIWRWYWQTWRRQLWKIHAAILVLTVFLLVVCVRRGGNDTERDLIVIATGGALILAWFVLHPQVMYKPQRRSLLIDAAGISTTIGSRSGQRRWNEISTVSEAGDAIVIQVRNGNAFIVPNRAFMSSEQREGLLAFAKAQLDASER
jgi:hypothetical protein